MPISKTSKTNLRNNVILMPLPWSSDRYVPIRMQIGCGIVSLRVEADKGQENEEDSIKLLETLRNIFVETGVNHETYTRDFQGQERIDSVRILAPGQEYLDEEGTF